MSKVHTEYLPGSHCTPSTHNRRLVRRVMTQKQYNNTRWCERGKRYTNPIQCMYFVSSLRHTFPTICTMQCMYIKTHDKS